VAVIVTPRVAAMATIAEAVVLFLDPLYPEEAPRSAIPHHAPRAREV